MYHEGKKIYSYKPNGEIILYNTSSETNEIEGKFVITTLDGNPLKIDTLNLDSLSKSIRDIFQGIGQYEKWIFKSSSTFHKNGKVKKHLLYTNGGKTALFTSFDDTGKPIEKGNKINNNGKEGKDGEWLKYDKNGKIARKENYVDGVRIEQIRYYPSGKIKQVETSKDDKYTKIAYYESGKIGLKKEIQNGSGEEITYDENGVIKSKTVFENGKDIKLQIQNH